MLKCVHLSFSLICDLLSCHRCANFRCANLRCVSLRCVSRYENCYASCCHQHFGFRENCCQCFSKESCCLRDNHQMSCCCDETQNGDSSLSCGSYHCYGSHNDDYMYDSQCDDCLDALLCGLNCDESSGSLPDSSDRASRGALCELGGSGPCVRNSSHECHVYAKHVHHDR